MFYLHTRMVQRFMGVRGNADREWWGSLKNIWHQLRHDSDQPIVLNPQNFIVFFFPTINDVLILTAKLKTTSSQ